MVIAIGIVVRWRSSAAGTPSASTHVPSLISSSHRSMQRRQIAHHALILLLLVRMDRLSMLAQIIEARELFAAMA